MSSEERLRLALRRFAPLILLCTLLGAVALVAVSVLQGPQYRATSQVIVENPDLNAALTENGTPSNESQTVGATAALLAASPGFFQFAARELHEPDWKALPAPSRSESVRRDRPDLLRRHRRLSRPCGGAGG